MTTQTELKAASFLDVYSPLCKFVDRCRTQHRRLMDRASGAMKNPEDPLLRQTFRRGRAQAQYLCRRIPRWIAVIDATIQGTSPAASELRLFLLAKKMDLSLWNHFFLLYSGAVAAPADPHDNEDRREEIVSAMLVADTSRALYRQVEHCYPMKARYRELRHFFKWSRRVNAEMTEAAQPPAAGGKEITARLMEFLRIRGGQAGLFLLFQGVEIAALRYALAAERLTVDINSIIGLSDAEPVLADGNEWPVLEGNRAQASDNGDIYVGPLPRTSPLADAARTAGANPRLVLEQMELFVSRAQQRQQRRGSTPGDDPIAETKDYYTQLEELNQAVKPFVSPDDLSLAFRIQSVESALKGLLDANGKYVLEISLPPHEKPSAFIMLRDAERRVQPLDEHCFQVDDDDSSAEQDEQAEPVELQAKDADATNTAQKAAASASRTNGAYDYMVTLDDAAIMVQKSKKTLERKRAADPEAPEPDIEGVNGKAHEWKWSRIRPWLIKTFSRPDLPERHPHDPRQHGL